MLKNIIVFKILFKSVVYVTTKNNICFITECPGHLGDGKCL